MRLQHIVMMCFAFVCVCSGFCIPGRGMATMPAEEGGRHSGIVADTAVTDTIWIEADTITTCILQSKVLLTCSDKYKDEDILSYKWIDESTKKVISTSREVWVTTLNTKEYSLEIQLLDVAKELIYNGAFELGSYNKKDFGFTSAYTLVPEDKNALLGNGRYVVSYDPSKNHPSAFYSIGDHTSGHGRMMIINGNTGRNVKVWGQRITGLQPGQQYAFSAWAVQVSYGAQPMLQYTINGVSLSSNNDNCKPPLMTWVRFHKYWTAGNQGVADICLVDQCTEGGGNDFAIDDVSFAPISQIKGKVLVKVRPQINLEALEDVEVCEGSDLQVVPRASGSEISDYQWVRQSDQVILGQSEQFSIRNASLQQDQGQYLCVVKGICGVDSAFFTVNVREKLKLNGPKTDTVAVCHGTGATLTANRLSGYNLSYAWRAPANNWAKPGKNWLPALADQVDYKKSYVDYTDAGQYRCIVQSNSDNTGTCGVDTIYSFLKVKNIPKLIKQTADTTVCVGNEFRLFVVTDAENPTTKWYFPDASFVIGNAITVTADVNTWIFKYAVEDGCKPLDGVVFVGVFESIGKLATIRDTTVCLGGTAKFKAKVSGTKLKYVWDGPNGFHATTPEITISDVTEAEEGTYHVWVSDTCGSVKEGVVKLSVYREFDNLVINDHKMYCRGDKGDTLQVKGGGEGLKYTWTSPNGKLILKNKVVLPVIGYDNIGTYICRVDGVCGNVKLTTEVGMYGKLVVGGNTGLSRVCKDEAIRLQANSNLPVLRFQWKKDGRPLGETGRELVLDPVGIPETGRYECTVVSVCGSDKLEYQVELKETTKITDATPDMYVNEFGSVRLFVNAVGENNVYKWTENGVSLNISGNKLFINNIGTSGIRTFVCDVSGDCGTDKRVIRVNIGKYNTLTGDRTERLCEDGGYSYNAGLLPAGCSGEVVLTYRWEYGGNVVSRNSLLEFKKLKQSDGGRYTCYISGSCGQAVLNLDIVVLAAPKLAAFPDTVSICELSEVIVVAHAPTNDILTFTWQKNGTPVGGTDSLFRKKEAELTDKGAYTCRVTGQCGDDVKGFHLLVRKKLKILGSQDTIADCDGKPVEMEVVAVGDRVEYLWNGPHKSGWTGENSFVYKNGAVVRGKDEGKYWCIVNSSCGRDTVYTVVDIEREMKLLAKSPDAMVCPGAKVKLYVRVNLEKAEYTWTLPGGTTDGSKELLIESVKSSDAGIYNYQIQGRCLSVEGTISLQLHKPLGELQLSRDTAVCEHDSVRLRAWVEGEGVTYQWRGPGHFLSGEASVGIHDVTAASAGKYNVVASDVCDRQRPGSVSLALLDEFKDVTAIGDTSLCPGSEFVAELKGGGDLLACRWLRDGHVIGEGRRLSVSAVSQKDTGVYVCQITGTCLTKEYPVRLDVYESLTVGETIDTVRVCQGVDTAFSVVADGEGVTYIWTRDGEEVGTREARLSFYEVTRLDTGVYVCRISSVCGEEERTFHLQLKPKTIVKSHTPDRFVTENDPTLLFVRAEGEKNGYEWWCDGVRIGDDNTMLYVPDIGKADTLNFLCAVEGECGVDTARMQIRVGVFMSLKELITPDTLCEGSNYTYVADVIPEDCYGDESFTYTWSFNGQNIGNGPLMKLDSVTLEQAGEYSCLVAGDCGQVSITWEVYVMSLPEIQWMTADAFVVEGLNHEIEVKAVGEGLSYVWTKDGHVYPENKTKLLFYPVSYDDRGIYRVSVGNSCSTVEQESELKVWQQTMIIIPLVSEAVLCQGQDSVFRVEAIGSNGLLYKWYHNGVLLPCPMIPELRLEGVGPEDAGIYMCVAAGKGGNDTCLMNLTVHELPEIDIEGLTGLCMNDLTQEYTAVSESPGLTYSWSVSDGILDGNPHFGGVEVTWQGVDEAWIMLEVTSAHTGCCAQAEKEIKYKQLPEVYLDLPEMVGYCLDSLVLNQGYPFGGYYWVNNQPATTVVFDYKEEEYQVVYVYEEQSPGCTNSGQQRIGVDKEPVIRVKERQIETGLCRPVVLVVEEASEGDIVWTGDSGLEMGDVLNPVYTPKIEDGENVYFSVELTDQYKCKASDYESIAIIPVPLVEAMSDAKAGVCGETILTAEYSTSRLDRLEWLPAEQLSEGENHSAILTEKIPGEHVYSVVVTDIYGCEGRDSLVITVMPSPPLDDREFCENESFFVGCHGYLGYIWNDGYIDSTRVLDKGGDYSLVITDEFGCVGTVYYTVHPMPAVELRDTVLYEGQTMQFVVYPEERYGPHDIVWQDHSSGSSYFVTEEGHYEVKVADRLGCMSQDTAYVQMKERFIAAPDAFLPNSSGENSRFYLKEVNFGSRFEMYIYDRWGELLFKTNEIGFRGGWDGSFKGIKCQPGAYVWVAFVDGKEAGKGTMVLVK